MSQSMRKHCYALLSKYLQTATPSHLLPLYLSNLKHNHCLPELLPKYPVYFPHDSQRGPFRMEVRSCHSSFITPEQFSLSLKAKLNVVTRKYPIELPKSSLTSSPANFPLAHIPLATTFPFSFILVIYCSITSHPRIQWLKMILCSLLGLWID